MVDNKFTVLLSATEPTDPVQKRNWLKLDPSLNKALFILRQTYKDLKGEVAANVTIRLKDRANSPSQWTCEQLDEALKTSGLFVAGASFMFTRWCVGFQKHINEMPLFDQETSNKAGGDPNIRYYHSYWKLAKDEALVIKATPPVCKTWNVQFNNHWMESLDYRYFTIHVNAHTAQYRPDKSVRVVLTHEDPKIQGTTYNWCTTTGHFEGQFCWRWIWPENEDFQHPVPTVVKVKDLEAFLKVD